MECWCFPTVPIPFGCGHHPPPNPHHFAPFQADSARGNLASTFVNAFVNAGYGTDKLITPADSKWLYRNKDNAVMSVAASLGMILQVPCVYVCVCVRERERVL